MNSVDLTPSLPLIKGGPGTGKSVIAINLMADLLLKGFNAHYATGSRAFTETLRKIIGARGSVQFKYFNSYAQAEHNIVDVLIAHSKKLARFNWFSIGASNFDLRPCLETIVDIHRDDKF